MATSTEATLTAAIVGAIEGIAQSELGFDQIGGNVLGVPLELLAEEERGPALMAAVGGKRRVRLWTVWVTASDEFYAAGAVMLRRYGVLVTGYYAVGVEGAGATLLRDHAMKIRGAIRGLGSTLSGIVDRTEPLGAISIQPIAGIDAPDGQILVGQFSFGAERRSPDY